MSLPHLPLPRPLRSRPGALALALVAGLGTWYGGAAERVVPAAPEEVPLAGVDAEADTAVYDLVIAGGRVIDPETGLDRSGWSVGVVGGTIARLAPGPLRGRRVVDAGGLVVAPGFIDPLSYPLNRVGARYKLTDGVTTNLALHGGVERPEAHFRQMEALGPPVHYGVGFFAAAARVSIGLDRFDTATVAQARELARRAERALEEGALTVSFSLEYFPGTRAREVEAILEVARRYEVPAVFHVRYSTMYGEGGDNLDALREVLGYGARTGVPIHVAHIHSTGGTFSMERSLALLDSARAEGVRVTADVYPYAYWATYLDSPRFSRGWRERFRIEPADLELVCRGDRLDEKSFRVERSRPGVLAVAHAIPPDDLRRAMLDRRVMVGSDGLIEPGPTGRVGCNNHPRGAGAFARFLRTAVREQGLLGLPEAVRRVTLLPAETFGEAVPALRRKGRIQPGMDADLVVFDPERITDRASVRAPATHSEGIRYVVVGGRVAVDGGRIVEGVRAGRAVRREGRADPSGPR